MEQNDKIRITLIGDIFPGELTYTQNYGMRTQFERHKGVPWKDKIKSIIGGNDLVIGNLESPLVAKGDILKKTFYGNPEFASFLKECGINVLNVANNHIMEQGTQGFQNTIQVLNKANLGIVGQISDSRSKILYTKIKGLVIAIAGFSSVDLHVIQNDGNFAVLTEENVLKALSEMEEAKADLKLLSFHWGNEYVHVPSIEQRKMAYKFIDHGANIIIGHHPHVIQPYEKYNDGHIFYSLGNFMFDFIHSKIFGIGLVASIDINEEKQFNVQMKGVKLSYDGTVTLLSSVKFEKYLSNIIKLYKEFTLFTEREYKMKYNTLTKRNRLRQRILMKTSIIKEFLSIKNRDRAYLVRNLCKYYLGL